MNRDSFLSIEGSAREVPGRSFRQRYNLVQAAQDYPQFPEGVKPFRVGFCASREPSKWAVFFMTEKICLLVRLCTETERKTAKEAERNLPWNFCGHLVVPGLAAGLTCL